MKMKDAVMELEVNNTAYLADEVDLGNNPNDKYCHECGREVKWDDDD